MARGQALCIGLNQVDAKHYQGWTGRLQACENDAIDLTTLSRSVGFSTTTLLTAEATRDRVLSALAACAKTLVAGDLLLLTYSGHGGQTPDLNGDEDDRQDETWCLYDGQLIDDELYTALGAFAAGVRIFALSDSCHSGTVLKAAGDEASLLTFGKKGFERLPFAARVIPADAAQRTYFANKAFYDPILKANTADAIKNVKASAVLISGCQDAETSLDGSFNGLFTGTLLATWNGGRFKGSYPDFHRAILQRIGGTQHPNYFTVGPRNAAFEAMTPFSI
ncbi:MAG: caspase family protein [Myxococcota bacterium]